MLSHDLRSPLQTIQMTARYLRQLDSNGDVGQAAGRLITSGARMQKLLDDLVDFTRTELGVGINVSLRDVDLGAVCEEELGHIRAAHPGRVIELEVDGNCRGSWDASRIQQLLNNLVVNAIYYGEAGGTTCVAVHGSDPDVRISVANSGKMIDREVLAQIFEPLRRGTDEAVANDAGLGLGLYIANEIAKAHRGAITATSEQRQTVFTVNLPRDRVFRDPVALLTRFDWQESLHCDAPDAVRLPAPHQYLADSGRRRRIGWPPAVPGRDPIRIGHVSAALDVVGVDRCRRNRLHRTREFKQCSAAGDRRCRRSPAALRPPCTHGPRLSRLARQVPLSHGVRRP